MSKVSKVKAKANEVYLVKLSMKTGVGSRKIPMDWLNVDLSTSATKIEKFSAHIGNARGHIVPEDIRKQLTNLKMRVRNSMTLKFVPMGFAGNSIKLMSASMLKEAAKEYEAINDEFQLLVNEIERDYDKYEKQFYEIFNELLKANPEKDAIIRELEYTMPTKMDYLGSMVFTFDYLKMEMNKDLEDRFVGKALAIAYNRAKLIEEASIKNEKIHLRSVAPIARDIEAIKQLDINDLSVTKEIIKDLNDLLALNGEGKGSKKKSKYISNKVLKYAEKINALDIVTA